MYEEYKKVTYDLATSNHMLRYKIDTFGGNSGSPVLIKDKMVAIGVHVQGGSINKATVIGPSGNDFPTFVSAFKATGKAATSEQGPKAKNYQLISMPANGRSTIVPYKILPKKESEEVGEHDEADEVFEDNEADSSESLTTDVSEALGVGMKGLTELVP